MFLKRIISLKILEKFSTSESASAHFWQNSALHASNSISFVLFQDKMFVFDKQRDLSQLLIPRAVFRSVTTRSELIIKINISRSRQLLKFCRLTNNLIHQLLQIIRFLTTDWRFFVGEILIFLSGFGAFV